MKEFANTIIVFAILSALILLALEVLEYILAYEIVKIVLCVVISNLLVQKGIVRIDRNFFNFIK